LPNRCPPPSRCLFPSSHEPCTLGRSLRVHGRCWSPTRYANGASSRGNAGVAEVSALVFDCDRVAPDPQRLSGVFWLGHTTWSHTAPAPRWRVVIPLVAPVPAAQWRDVWQRARAALCPEADPSCKDPSRQYYLPSHSGGVTAKATRHEGPLLDPETLPALPLERRRLSSTAVRRAAADKDRRRAEAYMGGVIDKLAAMAPNTGRNAALNGAAWTLGGWIAAGVLEQDSVEDALYRAVKSTAWSPTMDSASAGPRSVVVSARGCSGNHDEPLPIRTSIQGGTADSLRLQPLHNHKRLHQWIHKPVSEAPRRAELLEHGTSLLITELL
jgi:hypothetical protein